MGDLRTVRMLKKYEKFKARGFLAGGCNLCKASPMKNFKHWKIINNKFPWDRIAKINHMIIPKRHISENKLNKTEKKEFQKIKLEYIEEKYEYLMEATNRLKSIPKHFHIHLINLRDKI